MQSADCYLQLRQQFARGRRRDEYLAAVRVDEALGGAFLEQGKQRVVVAVDVQQPNLRQETEAGLSLFLFGWQQRVADRSVAVVHLLVCHEVRAGTR